MVPPKACGLQRRPVDDRHRSAAMPESNEPIQSGTTRRNEDPTTRANATQRWTADDTYWRENYQQRSYTTADRGYDTYQPAYRYGCEASFIYGNLPWDDEVELELKLGWPQARADSDLSWEQARDAVRDGFERARG
jgi:hypothetical protein